ncbi:MAG: hypothetical protein AAF628_12580 [Planctomycetota bacterium]
MVHQPTPRFLLAGVALSLSVAIFAPRGEAQRSHPHGLWYALMKDAVHVLPNGVIEQRLGFTDAVSVWPAPDGSVWVKELFWRLPGRPMSPLYHVEFTVSGPQRTVVPATPSAADEAVSVQFAPDGTIWILWSFGLLQQRSAERVLIRDWYSLGISGDMALDEFGMLWVVLHDNVRRFDTATGDHSIYRIPTPNGAWLRKLRITPRTGSTPSSVWIADEDQWLHQLDLNGQRLSLRRLGPAAPGADALTRPTPWRGALWIGVNTTGEVFELAADGSEIRRRLPFPGRIEGIDVDAGGNLLVRRVHGGFRKIERLDPQSGRVVAKMAVPFVPTPPPLVRADIVDAPDPAGWFRAAVIEPDADTDGDGDVNGVEAAAGRVARDPQSNLQRHVQVDGSQLLGETLLIREAGQLGLLFATQRASAPIAVPGVAGALRVDPTALITFVPSVAGGVLPVPIPPAAALIGVELYAQGLQGSPPGFANAVDIRITQ